MSKVAQRTGPLDDRNFGTTGTTLTPAPAATRISLRAREDGLAAAKKVLGFALPAKPKSSATKGSIHCLWIGPDEWLVIDADDSGLAGKFAKEGNTKLSAVDISHRNTAILLEGAKAVDVLNSGCPQDLSSAAFPVGACSRTILGKSEIVLYRTGEHAFRVECWRSFSDYVWSFLMDAAKSA